jgi:hypothetical protein
MKHLQVHFVYPTPRIQDSTYISEPIQIVYCVCKRPINGITGKLVHVSSLVVFNNAVHLTELS